MNGQTETSLVKASETAAIALTPETVLRYVNAMATGQEIALFLNQCAMFGLNPFKREIYLIKYSPKDPATFVVGYEVYLKRAERTKNWAGLESGTEDGKDGLPVKAWAKVYRKDWERPLYHEVFFNEYVGMKDEWKDNQKTGKKVPTKFWADKPKTMLKKVAIEQAFRMAFPDEFAGMPYGVEEMPVEHEKLPVAAVTVPADYEASKRVPLKDIKDEFCAPPAATAAPVHKPDLDIVADAEVVDAEPDPDGPSIAALETFGKLMADLKALGIGEETIWAGIHRYSADALKKVAMEVSEFTTGELDAVNGYLHRKKKATEADRAKKEKERG